MVWLERNPHLCSQIHKKWNSFCLLSKLNEPIIHSYSTQKTCKTWPNAFIFIGSYDLFSDLLPTITPPQTNGITTIAALVIFFWPRQKQISNKVISYGLYAIGNINPKIWSGKRQCNALTGVSYFNNDPSDKIIKSQNTYYN